MIVFILLVINMLVSVSTIYLFAIVYSIMPVKKLRLYFYQKMQNINYYWTGINKFILNTFTSTQWVLQGKDKLSPDQWYLLTANHRAWTDIIVVYKMLYNQLPPFKFFLKKELIWQIPFAGIGCWCLDFPFLIRHTKEAIRKHPELKNKDIETTRKACDKFKLSPCTIINFAEGTRFTPEKHSKQNSPYQQLLKPKSAGIGLVLEEMKNHIHELVDVTIKYSDTHPTFWHLISGQIKKITVAYRIVPVSSDLIGNYYEDREFRKHIQNWLNHLWEEKEKILNGLNDLN